MSRALPFADALDILARLEGGYVNDPDDPGGATYAGVSLRAVRGLDTNGDGLLDFDLDGDGDVDQDDIRRLKDHPEKIEEFYLSQYWAPIRGRELPAPLALFTFDAAVHHGPRPAVLLLQRGIGSRPDGVLGFRTLAQAQVAGAGAIDFCLMERAALMLAICERRPASRTFLRGWLRRLFTLQREASALNA